MTMLYIHSNIGFGDVIFRENSRLVCVVSLLRKLYGKLLADNLEMICCLFYELFIVSQFI